MCALVTGVQTCALPIFSYSPSLFQAPHDHPLTKLGAAGGFSGFRLMNKGNIGDWLAFQGASYFRSAGPLHQYGLSARGIAIDTGLSKTEEFPEFTEFRSEEHTSELQSLMRISYAVFCLKKKNKINK